MIKMLVALSVAALLPGAAIAAAAPEPTAETATPQPKKERLVCRSQERIGSRLGGKRICYTKARWAEIETDSMSAVRDFQQQRSSSPTNGN
jgi:hypothetical protein